MRGIAGQRLGAAIALALLAVGVFLASRWLALKGLVTATNVTTIASFVLAAATPAVLLTGKLLGKLSGAPPVASITLPEATADYAQALAKQWAQEDQLRRVYDPWPLPVRWRVADMQARQTQPFTGIRETFTRMPAQRMVILGAAGAGKSVLAIKLVRDLLASREPGDRVPVLLPAATWTRDCTMTEWITEQLVRSQPNLNVRIRTGTGTKVWLPRALADSGLIPVIDGLDELPADRRVAVISEINAFGSDYPVVLTSRPAEYHDATAARTISQAIVIELEPLEVPEIKAYLNEATDAPADRWQRVFGLLDAEPDGVLARTLATPLMIWLTRTVYQAAESHPDELLDPARLAGREALESHLVAAFVPAAYAERQTRSRPGAFRCSPARAERWLGFLASRLEKTHNQEIAWWQLPLAGRGLLTVSIAVRAVLYTCVFWQLSIWALARRGYWRNGAYVGHGHLQDLLLGGPLGRAVRPLTNAGVRWFATQVLKYETVSRLSGYIDTGLRYVAHLGLFSVAFIAAVVGAVAGFIGMFSKTTPAPQTMRVRWSKVLRRLLSPLPWGVVLAFLGWKASTQDQSFAAVLRTEAGWSALLWLGANIIQRVAGSVKTPVEVATRADPVGLLRADRRSYLATVAVMAASVGAMWLWAGSVIAIADGLRAVLGLAIVFLLGGSAAAWACYVDARLRLTMLGRLPWRTISFLDDAHRRGVLRQTGAVYQFRHIRLQQQLAAGYSPSPRPVMTVISRADRCLSRVWSLFPSSVAALVSIAPPQDASVTEYTASLEGRTRPKTQGITLLLLLALCSAVLTIVAFVALPGWFAFATVIADLLLIPLAINAYDQLKATSFLPSGTGSVHVTPDEVEITLGQHRVKMTAHDVERIAVRPIGNCLFSYAVYAKVRSGAVPPQPGQQNWLPLFWTPAYTAWIPAGLASALAGFGGDRLDRRLSDWVGQMTAAEYEASGTFEVKSLSTALRPYLAALLFSLVMTAVFQLSSLTGPVPLVVLADVALFLVCLYQLSLHRVRVRLPAGPWSLRVAENGIDITRVGHAIRLSAADIEAIGFRSIRANSVHTAVFAELRPEAAKRLRVKDGLLPLYWTRSFDSAVPPELLTALAAFASGRLTGSLKRKAARARHASAPVYRDS